MAEKQPSWRLWIAAVTNSGMSVYILTGQRPRSVGMFANKGRSHHVWKACS